MAAELEVTLQTDAPVVSMEESLVVTVSITGAGIRSIPTPKLPNSPFFQNVGTSTGQNYSIINGKMSASKTARFTLRPIKKGSARIGPVKVRFGKKVYQSNSVTVQVVDSAPIPDPTTGNVGANEARTIFLKAEVSPKQMYLGSQATVTLYLYSRLNVTDLGYAEIPEFSDFWAEELPTSNRVTFKDVMFGNVPYQAALLKRYALFPLKTGETQVGAFKMVAEVRSESKRSGRRNSPFGFEMFGNRRRVDLSSLPVSLNVLPLPTQGRPDGFENVVGRFRMTATLDRTTVNAGEPVTLDMIVSGEGNFKTLVAPKVAIPEQVSTYSEAGEQKVSAQGETIGGQKNFSMILVPREPGEFDIGPITLDYFDPVAGAYKQLTAGPFLVKVEGESVQTAQISLPITQQQVEQLGSDIRYIRSDAKRLREIRAPYYSHPLFLLLIGLWPPLLITIFLVRRYRKAAFGDRDKLRVRRASRLSRTRLKQARAIVDGEGAAFYAELTSAVLGYVADKTRRSSSGIVIATLLAELARAGASPALHDDMKQLFSTADAVRYGGAQADTKLRKDSVAKAERILDELDKKKLADKLERS
jgi:hypothetical protein